MRSAVEIAKKCWVGGQVQKGEQMNIIDFLNFQPFGDHGVMSLWSIRIAHIIMITAVTWLAKDIIKDLLNNE